MPKEIYREIGHTAPTNLDGKSSHTQVYASTTDQALGFTKAQTLNSYFTTRIVDDGLPVDDFMISSVYKLILSLFHCGHVQKIQVCNEIRSNNIFIQANYLPEMKYKIELQLEESSFEILAAQCGYPAGRGPRAS